MIQTNDTRRISVISAPPTVPSRDWDEASISSARMMFLDSLPALRHVLLQEVGEMQLDIERIVVDRLVTCDDFLELLTSLPQSFGGDVVYIREDDSAYLSATGRGGDRVLYALGRQDLRFYLETHCLVTGRIAARAA